MLNIGNPNTADEIREIVWVELGKHGQTFLPSIDREGNAQNQRRGIPRDDPIMVVKAGVHPVCAVQPRQVCY